MTATCTSIRDLLRENTPLQIFHKKKKKFLVQLYSVSLCGMYFVKPVTTYWQTLAISIHSHFTSLGTHTNQSEGLQPPDKSCYPLPGTFASF